MAQLFPFKGFYYDSATTPLKDVVIPPYDNISPEEARNFLAKSSVNLAHILLPNENDPHYTEASKNLRKWMEDGTLKFDSDAYYYLYEQEFLAEGQILRRFSLMATVEIHEFQDNVIRPHENTFGKYKEDRLRKLRATQCNLSHVFGMVRDPKNELLTVFEKVAHEKPFLKTETEDHVKHAIWKVPSTWNTVIEKWFSERNIYIVDGHHRYSSSLMYAHEKNALHDKLKPESSMLFSIARIEDPALVVFPTHRLISNTLGMKDGWQTRFQVRTEVNFDWLAQFVRKPAQSEAFLMYSDGKLQLIEPRIEESDRLQIGKALSRNPVVWSDHYLLANYFEVTDQNRSECITYERDFRKAWELRNQYQAVIFHAPISVEEVANVADEKGFMPQKSTFFFPKLAAGLIMRDHT